MKERIAYIINPISGITDKKAIADYVCKTTDTGKFDFEIYYTKCANDGFRQAKEFAGNGFDRVIAVGGDGTVNEVARGLLDSDTALGIIPLGSGNGFARHLKISLNYQKANQVAQNGKIITSDYGILNDKPFFCTAGIGFDAQVGQRFAQIGRRGFVSYAQASFMEYINYSPQNYKITIDGKTFSRRAFLITCANTSQWGYNAYIAPNASLNDGLIDLVIVSPFSFVVAPIIGLRVFTKSLYNSRNIEVYRAREVTIEREKTGCIHIDGEPLNEEKMLKIKAVPDKLKIIVPASVKRRLLHSSLKYIRFLN
ncbi:MAG: diacylglycerol kinase family lipid kinase [Prevotellaceae bacterium]|jgi:YegS/Rv2252/BmrU family lipid kinase|nr:diacylglycerol kinase family lipid kinase [Prevotellaceae bacterium]